jgi:Ca2+-binding RTX toxin-like protein
VAGSPANCGRIYDFGTAPGDSSVFSVYYGVRFFGSPEVAHNLTVTDGPGGPSHVRVAEHIDASTPIPTGSALLPGDSCTGSISSDSRSFIDTVDCTPPEHFLELDFAGNGADFVNQLGTSEISASLFGGDDYYSGYNALDSVSGMDGNDTIYGYDSGDALWGDAGNDYIDGGPGSEIRIDGGPGDDKLYGQGGDDLIYDPEGNNTVDCGPGTDTYYTDTVAHFNQSVNCENFVQANPGAAARSSTAAKEKFRLK